jgi:hypothetical protein
MGSTDNKPVVRFATGLDADDWLKEDIQVATPENDPNVYDPRRSRRHNVFSMPSGGMRRDLAGIDRDRSGIFRISRIGYVSRMRTCSDTYLELAIFISRVSWSTAIQVAF